MDRVVQFQKQLTWDKVNTDWRRHPFQLAALAGGAVVLSGTAFYFWPLLRIGWMEAVSFVTSFIWGTKEERMLKHVLANAQRGNPQSVVDTIDKWCWDAHWMMNVGNVKGTILDTTIERANPKVAVELGCYCGYSAVRIGRLLANDAKFYSIEVNPVYARIASQIIEFAGLKNKCQVIVGDSAEVLKKLKQITQQEHIDLFFLDHWKNVYLRDFKIIEEQGLLKSGGVVVADNVIFPGTPDYLRYVRGNPAYNCTFYESKLEYSYVVDGLEVLIKK